MIYAVGDIHGHLAKLDGLLSRLPLERGDTLVFVGDYVDRGPDSAGVVERLLQIREERPGTVFLRGNHEHMMVLARSRFDPAWEAAGTLPSFDVATLWFAEGGAATISSYKERYLGDEARWWQMIPETHWRFILDTKMEHMTDRYHFVHAGLLPAGLEWPDDVLQADPRLWIREPFLSSQQDFDGRVVVFGHTSQRSGRALVRANKIGIDTGAAFGGPLTALGLDETGLARPLIYQS